MTDRLEPWWAVWERPHGSGFFSLRREGGVRAAWYGHALGDCEWLSKRHILRRCENCGAVMEAWAVKDGPDILGGYAIWRPCPMREQEESVCPNCGADIEWIEPGPCLYCARCGHFFGFPAMVQADEICHYPKGHPLRKRKTDPRDPHKIDVKRAELEAEVEARWKEMGHDMTRWRIFWPVSACWCRVCNRTAVVNPYPRENDIERSGDALRNLCARGRNT